MPRSLPDSHLFNFIALLISIIYRYASTTCNNDTISALLPYGGGGGGWKDGKLHNL